jgi:hypothetical protein
MTREIKVRIVGKDATNVMNLHCEKCGALIRRATDRTGEEPCVETWTCECAFRAAAHQWFADGRLINEAIDMALGVASFPLPLEAERQRIHEWIARRQQLQTHFVAIGLSVEEVAELGDLIGGGDNGSKQG